MASSTPHSSVDNAGVIRDQLWSVMVTPGQFMALITTQTAALAVTESLLYNILNHVFFFLYMKCILFPCSSAICCDVRNDCYCYFLSTLWKISSENILFAKKQGFSISTRRLLRTRYGVDHRWYWGNLARIFLLFTKKLKQVICACRLWYRKISKSAAWVRFAVEIASVCRKNLEKDQQCETFKVLQAFY